jgi:hypothetical protein
MALVSHVMGGNGFSGDVALASQAIGGIGF